MSDLDHADWTGVPDHMRQGIRLWIEEGIATGSFLQAVIKNDLATAIKTADTTNKRCLLEIVEFFQMYAPSESWGSEQNFHQWQGQGGLAKRETFHTGHPHIDDYNWRMELSQKMHQIGIAINAGDPVEKEEGLNISLAAGLMAGMAFELKRGQKK